MKRRKGGLLQRMMAVLLSAVLVVGMVSNAAPAIVFAQEDGKTAEKTDNPELGEPVQEETGFEEQETDKPDGSEDIDSEEPEDKEDNTPEDPEDKEDSTPEDPEDTEDGTPEDGTEEETPEPDTEEETEPETVSENTIAEEENGILLALLARIAALPDAEEYLATEPDANDWAENEDAYEDAYEEWLAGLYAYAEEALAIQEAVEELSEEERAQISEEELQKLAAWAEIAQTAGESAQVMAAAETAPQADNIAGDESRGWILDKDGKLTINSNEGMTNWTENGRRLSYNCNGEYKWGYNIVTSVEISNGVTSIVAHAFSGCKNLPEIRLPEGVTSIGESAFLGCKNLTRITLPEGVESIGGSAFDSCSNLISITIPQSIKSIGDLVFGGCTNLQTVMVCSNTPPACGGDIFYYSNNAKVYVPVCDYLTASGWIQYKSKIVPEKHTGDISYSASGNKITQKCGTCKTEYGTATLSSSETSFTYTGTAITPVSVTYADSAPNNTWSGEKSEAITYENNINAGTATASLTLGTGETAATATRTFTIRPKALTDGMVTLSADSFPHTGNAVTPEVTVQDGGTILTKDIDYTVSYTNNSAVGTATVIVTGKGNYREAVAKNFQIVVSDADKAAAKTVVETALEGITATNATTKEEILGVINTALSNAGIAGVTVEIDKFIKYNASTSAAGHIEGVVFIDYCGQTVGSVNMEKPIAQLTAGKYTVAVNNGAGGGEYAAGDTVTIKADTPASGQQFDKWVVNYGNVTLADAASSTTIFTMRAEAVSVTATYKTNTGGGSTGGGSTGGGSTGGGNTGGGSIGGGSTGGGNTGGGSTGGGNTGGGSTGGGSTGGGNSDSGNNNNDTDGGSNNNGDSDSGSGASGETGAAASKTPDASGAGQPRVKQEKEGNIQKEVWVEGESTLDVVVATPLPALSEMVLTKEEKEKAAGGTQISIVLDMKVASAVVSAADRAIVEEAMRGPAAGYTIGQYLDVSLYKVIGDSRTAITQTPGKITVRIDVPEGLRNTDSRRARTFAVIRVHDGKAQVLADLDQDADTITIETDRFSTYAVVYKDTAAGAGNPGGGESGSIQLRAESGGGKESGNGKDDEPKTGDNTPLELSATLAMIAGFAYLLLYFTDRERGMTEETKKELVSRLVGWAKRGGKIRKYLALAAIFVLLVYYHSIGKRTCAEWKAIYGE